MSADVAPGAPAARARLPLILRMVDRGGWVLLAALVLAAVVVPVLNLAVPPGAALHLPTYVVVLMGKYLCYALLALSIDLVWGFCGILSLGHGAFFALAAMPWACT